MQAPTSIKALVLGCGLQGRAAVYDLAHSTNVSHVTCADIQPVGSRLDGIANNNVETVTLDAGEPTALCALLDNGYDIVIDLLPRHLVRPVAEAAIGARVHLVNTYYDHALRDLDEAARDADIAILPEMGLDPGIDLVMAAEAVRRFDRVTHLDSYGAGIPEPGADDNALRYRISWTWGGVLDAYARPARILRDGEVLDVPATDLFDTDVTHTVTVPPFGELEAYPNGDAIEYAQRLGIAKDVRHTGRYALRWPGHCQFWHVLARTGLLSEEPDEALGISPRTFLREHLEPQLQYGPHQRDLVIVRVNVRGTGAHGSSLTFELIDRRDLATGLMAMNRTVGFAASIAAQLIASGEIQRRGVLSPLHDVPWMPFRKALEQRGIHITERAS